MVSDHNVERELGKMMLFPDVKRLIELLFGGEYTEDVIHTLFDELDIDTANQNYVLMVSCLGYMKNWKYFPKEVLPRLKGLHRYCQVLNSKGIPWLVQQIRILADAGIPVMFLKGIAMRAYYTPDTPRVMWDYDLAVPEKQYRKAVKLLCDAGGVIKGECLHSSAIANGREEIDLHRWVFKANEESKTDFWENAVSFSFYGVEVSVPAPEDMLIHQLDTQAGDFFSSVPLANAVKWIYDWRRIAEFMGGFELSDIAARAKELHVWNQVRFVLQQYIYYCPDLIEKSEFHKVFPPSEEYDDWLKNGERCRKKLTKYRELCRIDKENGAASLLFYIHMIRLELARYHFYKWRKRYFGQDISLFQFFKETKKTGSFSEAVVYMVKKLKEVLSGDFVRQERNG